MENGKRVVDYVSLIHNVWRRDSASLDLLRDFRQMGLVSFKSKEKTNVVIKDILRSFQIAWVILSIGIFIVISAPFILPNDTILGLSAKLKLKNEIITKCSLCGMTRSFVMISNGRFKEADSVNALSTPTYLFFLLNELFLINFLLKRLFVLKIGIKGGSK